MGLKDPEIGDRQRFEVRRGVGGFSQWGGINRNTDPSGIDPWEFHLLVNASFDDETIKSRGGQAKLGSDTAMGDCVLGIIDLGWDTAGGTNLFAGTGLGGAGDLYVINDENSPVQYAVGTQGPTSLQIFLGQSDTPRRRRVLHLYQGQLIMHLYDGLTSIDYLARVNVRSDAGVVILDYTKLVNLITPAHNAVEFQDKLWLSDTGLGTGSVYTWDGTSLVRDATALGSGDLLIVRFQEDVLVFGTNFCKKRNNGLWSTVTMPGGMTSFRALDSAVYNNTLYVSGRDEAVGVWKPTILSYDGTTLSIAHQVAWTGTANESEREGVWAMTVFNSLLYFGYGGRRGTNDNCAPIGSYNGSTWTDVVYDFGDFLTNGIDARAVYSLCEYRGNLRVGLGQWSTVTPKGVAKSAGTTVTSWTYEAQQSDQALDLLVF